MDMIYNAHNYVIVSANILHVRIRILHNVTEMTVKHLKFNSIALYHNVVKSFSH